MGLIWTTLTQAGDLYPFTSKQQEVQFQYLAQNLRCLVCQNQSLADSNAFLAHDLKNELYTMVKQGATNDEIMHYFQQRYGDFVLFHPPLEFKTLFLWGCPIFLMLLGLLLFWWYGLKRGTN